RSRSPGRANENTWRDLEQLAPRVLSVRRVHCVDERRAHDVVEPVDRSFACSSGIRGAIKLSVGALSYLGPGRMPLAPGEVPELLEGAGLVGAKQPSLVRSAISGVHAVEQVVRPARQPAQRVLSVAGLQRVDRPEIETRDIEPEDRSGS